MNRHAGIGVVPLVGHLINRPDPISESLFGATSLHRFLQRFRLATAHEQTIVLEVDSMGGELAGVHEAAAEVFAARSQRRVVAVANTHALGGAYWIAAAAHEVIVTQSGEVGSIGVVETHVDASNFFEEKRGEKYTLISAGKYKTEGHPFGPLGGEARAYMQSQVDGRHRTFLAAISRYRGRPLSEVRERFGEGRAVGARDAVSLGMADRIATLDAVLRDEAARVRSARVSTPAAGAVRHRGSRRWAFSF